MNFRIAKLYEGWLFCYTREDFVRWVAKKRSLFCVYAKDNIPFCVYTKGNPLKVSGLPEPLYRCVYAGDSVYRIRYGFVLSGLCFRLLPCVYATLTLYSPAIQHTGTRLTQTHSCVRARAGGARGEPSLHFCIALSSLHFCIHHSPHDSSHTSGTAC